VSMKNDIRIAIIGAGISGLSAAHILRQKGYSNVVLFEEKDRIGGKINTLEKEGCFYELGGIFVQGSFNTVKGLLRDYGGSLTPKQPLKAAVVRNGQQTSMSKYVREKYGVFKSAQSFCRIARLLVKHDELAQPSFARIDPSMHRTIDHYAADHAIEPISYAIAPFVTGMGYGYVDSTPALHAMMLIKRTLGFAVGLELNSAIGTKIPVTYYVKNGYRMFLEKIAVHFDVRLKTGVHKVERLRNGDRFRIIISTTAEEETFDRLFISSPPPDTRKFLDMNEEEAQVLKPVRNLFFQTTLFYGRNLPNDRMLFFPNATSSSRMDGFPVCIANFHPKKNIFQAYQLHDGSLAIEKLEEMLRRVVIMLGGTTGDILTRETFTYLSHYSEKDLCRVRPYERLERLQGKNGTYFIGGLVSMESADDVASHAQQLVFRHF